MGFPFIYLPPYDVRGANFHGRGIFCCCKVLFKVYIFTLDVELFLEPFKSLLLWCWLWMKIRKTCLGSLSQIYTPAGSGRMMVAVSICEFIPPNR